MTKNMRMPDTPAEMIASGQTCDLPSGEVSREEQAFALYCQGTRVAAIAVRFGVSQTTVRRWVQRGLGELADDARREHEAQLLRAIAAQQEIARAAWEAYHREQCIDDAVLRGEMDRVRRRTARRLPRRERDASPKAPDAAPEGLLEEEYERPRHTSQGARYLAVALAAQREAARLQGLYARVQRPAPDLRITLTRRPDGSGENQADPEGATPDPAEPDA